MKLAVTRFTLVAVVAGLFGSVGAARAQTDALWPKFEVSLGGYRLSTDDKIRLDASDGALGTEISVERELGLPDTKSLLTGRLDWGFADRHSLALRYYSLQREGSRAIASEIEIEGETFPVGARLKTGLDTKSFEAIYNYWLVRQENLGLAASLGLVYLQVDATFTGEAVIGPGGATGQRRVGASSDLPVPMLGIELKGRPARWLILRGGVRYLPSVKVGDVDGEAASYAVGAEFQIWGPVAIDVGYLGNFFNVQVSDSDWNGSADFETKGWSAGLRFHF